jgi:hypothetical protein
MGKKKNPGLLPFMVIVSKLVEYPLPIAATSVENAREIALTLVDNGWAVDAEHENDATVDNAEPASDREIKEYKFMDVETETHKF